ncbi:hypothetical protein [Pseudomonas sp.]|uniref:hypothetical protein n=1 Tax=Pseudomonas sp. TaxID=306 RepID=UPI003CC5DC1E
MPTPSPTTQTPSQRVVVESIGSARPALAGLLASQLGLPANQVANALYKAPSVLLEALPQEQACGLASILQQAGLAVRVEPNSVPRPAAAATFDIALYVTGVADLPACCERLARFLGCLPAAVLGLLSSPPGVIIGDVSAATCAALQQQLADLSVELVCSRRDEARYQLLIERAPGPQLDSLLHDLRQLGIALDPANDQPQGTLNHTNAQQLWRRHQAGGGLRLLDTAFLRYDLSLEAVDANSQTERLPELAGLPAALIDCVLENLPVVVEEGVAHPALPARLQAWQAAGMPVRPQVASLRRCRLRVPAGSRLGPALSLLQQSGLLPPYSALPRLPWQSPVLHGELLPRWLQHSFEQLDIPVEWQELDHEQH